MGLDGKIKLKLHMELIYMKKLLNLFTCTVGNGGRPGGRSLSECRVVVKRRGACRYQCSDPFSPFFLSFPLTSVTVISLNGLREYLNGRSALGEGL